MLKVQRSELERWQELERRLTFQCRKAPAHVRPGLVAARDIIRERLQWLTAEPITHEGAFYAVTVCRNGDRTDFLRGTPLLHGTSVRVLWPDRNITTETVRYHAGMTFIDIPVHGVITPVRLRESGILLQRVER